MDPEPEELEPSSAGMSQLLSPSAGAGFEARVRTAVSLKLGDGTNHHCRRLFACRLEFKFGEK